MSFSLWLARLSGARTSILQKAPGDVNKHAAMGGVLLSTAGVAAVSAFFALHSVLELPLAAAVAVGLLWGVVIFNLDRMLVVTMTRGHGLLLNLLAALPRVGLALVIGSIISMPLVLRIFEPEINSELVVMQAEATTAKQQKYDEAYGRIKELEGVEAELLAVVSGRAATSVTDDPEVKTRKAELDAAEKTYQDAAASAQCEYDGTCGTGVPGDGESYRQKKRAADEARATRDRARAALDETTAKVSGRLESGKATDTENARKRLPEVQADLARLRGEREEMEKRGSTATASDTGLLARLEALDRITEGRGSGGQAHLALFLLFLCIELLPVIVKLLSGIGPETLYDRMLRRTDDGSDADDKLWADRDRDLAVDRADQKLAMQRQELDAQTRAHARTTQLVADKQFEMAKKAIDVWARLAQQRTDQELDQWIRQHGGRAAAAPTTRPAANGFDMTVPFKPVGGFGPTGTADHTTPIPFTPLPGVNGVRPGTSGPIPHP
ncbi:DUF4407 domain-containing protein [Saccharothrix syringae]|nr:DUF4407 domain-containing protein [Saccharothrix syringae]